MIRVALGGATGWTGEPLARAIRAAEDLELVTAVSRTRAGMDLGTALGEEPWGVPIVGSVAEALSAGATVAPGGVDVYIDYTSHAVVRVPATGSIQHTASIKKLRWIVWI